MSLHQVVVKQSVTLLNVDPLALNGDVSTQLNAALLNIPQLSAISTVSAHYYVGFLINILTYCLSELIDRISSDHTTSQ